MSVVDPLSLDALNQRHPEWSAWLSVHRVVRAALKDPGWAAAVPATPAGDGITMPLVTGTSFALDERKVSTFVDALLETAGAPRLGEKTTAIGLLDAAVAMDEERLGAIAREAGVDEALLTAIAPLAASPLLQACAREWRAGVASTWDSRAGVAPAWEGAACPVCGAWAAVMEARGVERVYRLRCGRCGADWGVEPVRCPFCGERDHEKLAGLAGDGKGDLRRVEACTVCLGYVKSVTTLSACPPEDVALLDLATVELDVAALDHGYARPSQPAFRPDTRVTAKPRGRLRALLGRR